MRTLSFLNLSIAALLAGPAGAHAQTPSGIIIGGVAPQAVLGAPRTARAPLKLPVPIIDEDVAGREPFQASVELTLQHPYVVVSIPAGKRLIVDHIAMNGDVTTPSGAIQTYVVVGPTLNAQQGTNTVNYIYPCTASLVVSGRITATQQVTLYADSLAVSYGYAGTTPNYIDQDVSISGT